MTSRTVLMIAALALSMASNAVRADWDTEGERRSAEAAYVAGQAAERAGKLAEALENYRMAQSSYNPNAIKAAQRAAQIAPGLASAEEKKGNHAQAATLYDQGGHFAAADRALMAAMRAKLDSPQVVGELLKRFDERASEHFKAMQKLRLEVTGPYTPDASLVQEVRTALAKGPERTLQREAAAFDANYLKERVALARSLPETVDMAAQMAAAERERAFLQKWPDEPLKKSLGELAILRQWQRVEPNPAVQTSIDAQLLKRAEERAATLVASYSGAPEFLEAAKDYALAVQHLKPAEPRIASIKATANKLGDEAEGKSQFALAASYFRVADERDKTEAVQKRQGQLAMQKMQPDIDAAKRTAEAMRAQYGDPAKVEAMRKQAQAMQAAMQAQRPSAERAKQDAGDLQKELGLK
jgi:hypothetical protein